MGQNGRAPFPHRSWIKPYHFFFGGGRRAQGSSRSLTSVVQWLLVSRISQMQAWAIPAVRESTDPHCGPLICCLATRALGTGARFPRAALGISQVGPRCEALGCTLREGGR